MENDERDILIAKLQRALAFWMPRVPCEDTPRTDRMHADIELLYGSESNEKTCAEALGWIALTGEGKK